MRWYGVIASNDEAANHFYIFCFTYVPYTLKEDVELDGNQLVSGDLVCNAIYKSPGRHKSLFMLIHVKTKNCDCVNEYSCYSKS